MRTFRTARVARPARLLAATGVALAALALTACDNGMGARDEGAAGGSNSTEQTTGTSGTTTGATTTDKAASKTGTGTGTSTSGGTGTSGGSNADKNSPNGETTAPYDPANRVTCNGSTTTTTTTTAQPVSRPLNHMLITVKNTGSKFCDLYYSPSVRFGEAQSAPRVIEESQPQAVVTLAPGESGYAGVLLSSADGSGGDGLTEKKVVIYFQGREPGSDAGAPASPALPAKGVYVDNSVAVTYWQSSVEHALMY